MKQQPEKFRHVCVVGLGYIGLPTAAAFASRKVTVTGVDTNATIVDLVNNGEVHIVEPELDIVVRATVADSYLRAVTEPVPADAFLIAVPTPFLENKLPDLSFIESACHSVARVLKKGDLVILESTSPVGATEQMVAWMAEERPDLKFPALSGNDADVQVAHCPERVLPGHTMRELVENDRVIGGVTRQCAERARDLYRVFVDGDLILTDARTAEMAKLTENAFRDVNIAFANELSLICDRLDINVWELIGLSNRHPRVNILRPGPGVGGHCIAVDPWFIVSSAPDLSHLIRTSRQVNDGKPAFVVQKILSAMQNSGASQVVCLGLSFKPDIDDLRESAAVKVVHALLENGVSVLAVEPNIRKLPERLAAAGCQLCDLEQALAREDTIIAGLVAHRSFKANATTLGPRLLDFCGIFDPDGAA